jgi:hypothetical protein
MKISVTYEIATEESIELGGNDDTGFIVTQEDNWSLRECIGEVFRTETNTSEFSGCCGDRWFTVANSMDWITGRSESRSLHIAGITESSKRRLFKLLGV